METLVKIQNELKVPKGNLNKFGNYKYRSAEDILEAVKPILLKYNTLLILSDEIYGGGEQGKSFVKATATIYLGEKKIVVNGFAELAEHKGMSAEQATGTASSYARKYALNGLFLIDETEADADSQKPQPKEEKKEVVLDNIPAIKNAYAAGKITKEKAIELQEALNPKKDLEFLLQNPTYPSTK